MKHSRWSIPLTCILALTFLLGPISGTLQPAFAQEGDTPPEEEPTPAPEGADARGEEVDLGESFPDDLSGYEYVPSNEKNPKEADWSVFSDEIHAFVGGDEYISAHPVNNTLYAYNYTPDGQVFVRIMDQMGGTTLWQGYTTTNGDGYLGMDTPVDIEPGNYIAVRDMTTNTLKTIVVKDIVLKSVNFNTNVMSGTAAPGATVTVFYWNAIDEEFVSHTVTANASTGVWSYNIGALSDLLPYGWYGAAIVDADGDESLAEMIHLYGDMYNDDLNIINFSVDNNVNLSITDTSEPETYNAQISCESRWQDYWLDFDLYIGDQISATDIATGVTKTLTLQDVSISEVDYDADIVYGTAPDNSYVEVGSENTTNGDWTSIIVQTNSSGYWLADFSGIDDLDHDHKIEIQVSDNDGDRTVTDYEYQETRIEMFPQSDVYKIYGFTPYADVDVEIRLFDGGPIVMVETVTLDAKGYYETQIPYDIFPGMIMIADDLYGPYYRELECSDLRWISVDVEEDTYSGTSTNGAHLGAFYWNQYSQEWWEFFFEADGSGDWTYDMTGDTDLLPFGWFGVVQLDGDGDYTVLEYPRFDTRIRDNGSELYAFTHNYDVDWSIYDAPGGSVIDGPNSDGFDQENPWYPANVELAVNNVVVMKDTNYNVQKELTLTDISVTGAEVSTDIVGGLAPANAYLRVSATDWNSYHETIFTQVNSEGEWEVDFSGMVDVTMDTKFEITAADNDLDGTWTYWRFPYIEVDGYNNIEGFEFSPNEDVLVSLYSNPGDLSPSWQTTLTADEYGFWGFSSQDMNCNYLNPGGRIVAQDLTKGYTKELTYTHPDITTINHGTQVVSGTGPAGMEIEVGADAQDGWHSIVTTINGSGNWSVDFKPEDVYYLASDVNVWVHDEDGDASIRRENSSHMIADDHTLRYINARDDGGYYQTCPGDTTRLYYGWYTDSNENTQDYIDASDVDVYIDHAPDPNNELNWFTGPSTYNIWEGDQLGQYSITWYDVYLAPYTGGAYNIRVVNTLSEEVTGLEDPVGPGEEFNVILTIDVAWMPRLVVDGYKNIQGYNFTPDTDITLSLYASEASVTPLWQGTYTTDEYGNFSFSNEEMDCQTLSDGGYISAEDTANGVVKGLVYKHVDITSIDEDTGIVTGTSVYENWTIVSAYGDNGWNSRFENPDGDGLWEADFSVNGVSTLSSTVEVFVYDEDGDASYRREYSTWPNMEDDHSNYFLNAKSDDTTIDFCPGDTLYTYWGWSADSQSNTQDYIDYSDIDILVDSEAEFDTYSQARMYFSEVLPFNDWRDDELKNDFITWYSYTPDGLTPGEHSVQLIHSLSQEISDGVDNHGPGEQSNHTYTINVPVPIGSPTPTNPPNGKVTTYQTLNFAWTAVDDATRYQFQISDDNTFATTLEDITVYTNGYSYGVLPYGSTYYWRVQAGDGTFWSEWSDTWEVTVNKDTWEPNDTQGTAVGNFNMATQYQQYVQGYVNSLTDQDWFSYSMEAGQCVRFWINMQYRTKSYDSADMQLVIYRPDGSLLGMNNDGAAYNDPAIKVCVTETGTYTVRAKLEKGALPAADVDRTYQLMAQWLDVPTLTAPANGSSTTDTTPTFRWQAVDLAQIYDVEVATDASFSHIVYRASVRTLSATSTALPTGDTYYWHVRARNLRYIGDYSDVRNFRIP